MTPSQLEHLRLIEAHLDKLLDIAEKRTPGEWRKGGGMNMQMQDIGKIYVHPGIAAMFQGSLFAEEDSSFIASCAGNAEAGWRATKAAIKSLLALTHVPQVDASDEYLTCCEHYAKDAHDALESILSAWPIEMLTK